MIGFEESLTAAINAEIARMTENMLMNPDMRLFDRNFGGIHALRLVLEEFIPDVNKKLNEQ